MREKHCQNVRSVPGIELLSLFFSFLFFSFFLSSFFLRASAVHNNLRSWPSSARAIIAGSSRFVCACDERERERERGERERESRERDTRD